MMEHNQVVNMVESETPAMVKNGEGFIGVLDVYVHQARDIHNICIYHKQDVYAKAFLTNDPEQAVSTQIINGGGKNPVFDQNLRLNVRTIESSSLRCEIWMMSRVKNYMQDQLLGFSLVPLCDVLVVNGKPEQEFSLSSSDLFHSPCGFVKLTLTYAGATPEVIEIPKPGRSLAASNECDDGCGIVDDNSIPCELVKIEFPDPEILNENERMVTEYFAIPCTELDSQSSECIDTTENGEHASSENIERAPETVAVEGQDSTVTEKESLAKDSPSSVCDAKEKSNTVNKESVLALEESKDDAKEVDSTLPGVAVSMFTPPVVVVPEQKVVQQEIVDMYMKSMQQFTEALAKMKLPLDIENGSVIQNGNGNSESSSSSEKPQATPRPSGQTPKVFYGSRAFF